MKKTLWKHWPCFARWRISDLKYIDEFRQTEVAKRLAQKIHQLAAGKKMAFMEVCGTHTMTIARNGIREMLPESITLISGPGCPVCVTPNRFVDTAIALSRQQDVIITTFGDMIKVPGSTSSLEAERASGGNIQIVGSTLEALDLAGIHPEKKVVFLGIGFETTAPTVAASILEARRLALQNYHVLCAHKTMPPAMDVLSRGEVHIDGYLCPGHVSTIIGSDAYFPIVDKYRIGCVIGGFEPLDVLQSILLLVQQVRSGSPAVENEYSRAVRPEGNRKARGILSEVFDSCDSEWRGIGVIPESGLKICESYQQWDALVQIPVQVEQTREHRLCRCGEVLRGKIRPLECSLFGAGCTPDTPIGACMVSTEGTCAAYYKYQAYQKN
jgi:hydrogenase expression/formation protein HypD